MSLVRFSVLAVGLLMAATLAEAQQVGGSAIQGRAVDQQQAVLPGVTIVITHQETGTFRETATGPEGTYFITGLPPGPYRVTADLQGFKRLTRENVRLQLGATQTLELTLEVGAVAETVTVSGQAALVDLTSAQVGGTLESAELTELPTPSRNIVGFVAMLPGLQLNPDPGSDSVNVNGQHDSQVNFVLDGGNNTDDVAGSPGGSQARAPLEAIQEMQVVTNQFDVEFGRTTGGIVNAITKAGTNVVRGSAFGHFTNSGMTVPTIFVEQSGGSLEEADTAKRQWGGTVGGPIVRDKLHFFSSFERVVLGTGISNVFPTRPELSFSETQGNNAYNVLVRVDHQLNADNTYSVRYLTERQPNRNLISSSRATLTTFDYELDYDTTAVVAHNWVLGNTQLNTFRVSFVQEDIERGAEPGTFLETRRKDLEPPVLRFLSFDEQGHVNAHSRTVNAYAIDDSFSWFVPGKRGDHDLKFGFQYLYAENPLSEQGTMNGAFTFPGDRPFNAADPSTYAERLTIRVPGESALALHTNSFGFFGQDKWRLTSKFTLSLGLRYDVDIAPFRQPDNPLLGDSSDYPVDKNNFQPRVGFAYNWDGRSVIRGGAGRYYEKLMIGLYQPLALNGVFGDSFIVNFPVSTPDPGPSQGRLPTDPMLVNGPVVNRELLGRLYPPGTVVRNTSTVQMDSPDRQLSRSTQVSFGYERQLGQTMSLGLDYVHNWGRGWLGYNLNPGLRVDTSRTGPIVRTDLLGLAQQLEIPPFANNVYLRADYTGETEYDGLNLQFERRFSGFWGARASYTLGNARGNNDGNPAPVNNLQVLEERNLDLNWGPLDTDRRHNLVLSGRLEAPQLKGVTISSVFRIMSGRPLSITNSNVDADRNGILFDPLPAGTYTGVGNNAMTVKNKGGRNGAYGPNYAQLDLRIGYRLRAGGNRTLDAFGEVYNITNETNFLNPSGDQRLPEFLVPTALFAGGFPRQLQLGLRFGF